MPIIYEGVCRNCSYRTSVMTDGYGAVLVDRPVESTQTEIAGACLFSDSVGKLAEAADPRLVVLAHPLEDAILADTGYTWKDLFWQGRYVSVSNVCYRRCGHLFQRRRLDAGQAGCSAALALGLASGAAAGLAARNLLIGFIVCYVVGLSVALTVGFIAQRYLRWKFPARAAALAAESTCAACGADDSAAIVGAKSVFCPACRQRTLRFKSAGIS